MNSAGGCLFEQERTESFFCVFIAGILTALQILRIPIMRAEKVEGTIPYHENCTYIVRGNSINELTENGIITKYTVEHIDAYSKRAVRKSEPVHTTPRIKYSQFMTIFISEDDRVFLGNGEGFPGKEIGTVKNAVNGDACNDHVAVVTSKGQLFVYGDNSDGALGLEQKNVDEFTEIPYLQNITKAVCGVYSTFALNNQGEVFLSGRLGAIENDTFVKLEVPEKVKDIEISFASETIVILGVKGNVYEMGTSYFAEDYYDPWSDNDEFYTSFHQISKLKNVSKISRMGGMGQIAIDKDGRVFYWGARMIGKTTELEKTMKWIKNVPKAEEAWISGNILYVLSKGKITVHFLIL